MRSKSMLILAGACLAMASNQSQAAVSYSYVTDAASYDVSGGSATVNVYLQETLTDSSPSQIGPSGLTSGLDGAAFKVDWISGNSAKLNDLAYNPAFDSGSPINSKTALPLTTSASLTESTLATSNGVGLDDNGRVFLGGITLGSDVGSGLTTFSILPYDNNVGNIISRDGTLLDDPSPPTAATFTAVVPEPAGMLLLGLGGLVAIGRRRSDLRKVSQ